MNNCRIMSLEEFEDLVFNQRLEDAAIDWDILIEDVESGKNKNPVTSKEQALRNATELRNAKRPLDFYVVYQD